MHPENPYDLSVVLVSFMAGKEVRECLQSLLPFENSLRCEFIVVDNSPPDVLRHLRESEVPDVRVIPNPRNLGYAASCNRALQESSAPFLLFLDPDARYVSGSMRGLLQWLEGDPSIGLVGPRILNPDGTRQFSSRSFPTWRTIFCHRYSLLTKLFPNNRFTRRYLRTDLDRERAEVDWASGCCLVARRNALEEAGGFDEGYFLFFEDVDLSYRLRKCGLTCVYYPELMFVHTIGAGGRGQLRDRGATAKYFSAARYFTKNILQSAFLADRLAAGSFLRRGLSSLYHNWFGQTASATTEDSSHS